MNGTQLLMDFDSLAGIDNTPQARSADPVTSKLSAHCVQPLLSGLQITFMRVLGELGRATANEVAIAASNNRCRQETIRKRAGELKEAGRIRIVDRRTCEVTGSIASVYEVVGNATETNETK